MGGMTRATARRILLTYEQLGFVSRRERLFRLMPQATHLGWAYLSGLRLHEVVMPCVEQLAERTKESSLIAILDTPEVVCVGHIPGPTLIRTNLNVGDRAPAHATCVGRVLLAALSDQELEVFLEEAPLERLTERTMTDPDVLRTEIHNVREDGWALVDQELELGLRSIAAPIYDPSGATFAALNISSSARGDSPDVRGRIPALLETAQLISSRLRKWSSELSRDATALPTLERTTERVSHNGS